MLGSVVGLKSRILIAEDDLSVAAVLEEGLEANGFIVTVSPNGHDALVRADSDDVDLVVLDLGLPGRPGIEVLSELRARGRLVPIVILTALDTTEETVAGLEAGADDFIGKPFDLDEVIARIRARIREHRLRMKEAAAAVDATVPAQEGLEPSL
jgi:two-component system, OmpR family, response regulator QseB